MYLKCLQKQLSKKLFFISVRDEKKSVCHESLWHQSLHINSLQYLPILGRNMLINKFWYQLNFGCHNSSCKMTYCQNGIFFLHTDHHSGNILSTRTFNYELNFCQNLAQDRPTNLHRCSKGNEWKKEIMKTTFSLFS